MGYYLTQTTDDTSAAFASLQVGTERQLWCWGPGVRYVWSNFRNWKHEIFATNHTQGDAY